VAGPGVEELDDDVHELDLLLKVSVVECRV
jgi:hypothetical protein